MLGATAPMLGARSCCPHRGTSPPCTHPLDADPATVAGPAHIACALPSPRQVPDVVYIKTDLGIKMRMTPQDLIPRWEQVYPLEEKK